MFFGICVTNFGATYCLPVQCRKWFRKSLLPTYRTPENKYEFNHSNVRTKCFRLNGCHPVVWHNKSIYRYLRQYTTMFV